MNYIHIIYNEITSEIIAAFPTARAAKEYVKNIFIEEKNKKISYTLFNKEVDKSIRKTKIEEIKTKYDESINKLETYYNYYCNSNSMLSFYIDEYVISEVPYLDE